MNNAMQNYLFQLWLTTQLVSFEKGWASIPTPIELPRYIASNIVVTSE